MNYLIYDIKYLFVAIIGITLYSIFDKKTNKIQIIDIVIIVALIIISGIRCNFGSDSYNYYIQYNAINNLFGSFKEAFLSRYQSGFSMLCYIVYNITHFEFAIFWAVAFFIYPITIIYMRKYTQKPSVAFAVYVLMGFFVMSNNILKQYIAMTFLIIGYFSFLRNNKIIGYVIVVYIASKFHVTAIVAGLFIYVATKIKPNYKNFLCFIIIGIALSVLYNILIPIIVNKIPVFSKYSVYLELVRSKSTIMRGTINTITYIIMYSLLVLILLKNKSKILLPEIEGKNEVEQITFLFIAIMISIIAIKNQTINRIALYLYQFIVFMIPNIFSTKYERKLKRIYLVGLTFLIIIWFGINNIIGAENRYYSYSTYYNDTPKSYY